MPPIQGLARAGRAAVMPASSACHIGIAASRAHAVNVMDHAIPHKTELAHRLLAGPRQAIPAGLRMLLIMVDGRKPLGELATLARGLGLQPQSAFEQLRGQGLIAWAGEQGQAGRERAQRLVRAKFFALDLAARMLAGRDQGLREGARAVDSESSFAAWLDECAAEITRSADAERAALFRERVLAAAA